MSTGPIQRKQPVERTWLEPSRGPGRAWVDLVRGFASDSMPLFERLLAHARWQENWVIRGGRKVQDPRLTATMSRATSDAEPVLRYARLVLEARYRVRLMGPHLVLYRDGRDGMGFHRDDEMRYLHNTIVAGLALGATRTFAVCSFDRAQMHRFEMASGDLYVMGGRCQADWLHGVPKLAACGPKISAVWRWADKRGRPVEPRRDGP